MDRAEVERLLMFVRVELGSEYRAEMCAARAVVLRRHSGSERGWLASAALYGGVTEGVAQRCFDGNGSEVGYERVAEGFGLSLAALDCEAERLVAIAYEKRERKKTRVQG